jgi:hypothetical protein
MAQEPSSQRQELRFGLHVHIYVILTFVLLFAASLFLAGSFGFREESAAATFMAAVSGPVIFGAVLVMVARYCGSEVLSYWDGLRLVSHYLSMGVGALSLAFSFAGISIAIVLSMLFTLIGVVTNNRRLAQQRFLDFLRLVSKHRMYQ